MLRRQKEEYNKFSKAAGLRTENERTQVYGYDRSKSAKTVWAERKTASKSKMAMVSSCDWSKTIAQEHTQDELSEITVYAKERNIKLYNIATFDGDIEMLRKQIDVISNMKSEYNLNQKITLEFKIMPDNDFAETINNTIRFNNNAMRNAEITNFNLNSDNQLAATDFTGIAVHEMGHIVSAKYGEKGLDIAKQAYYNIFKQDISHTDLLDYLYDNISEYSIFVPYEKHSRKIKPKEITPEILSKSKSSSSTNFAEEFVKLLKEKCL